MLRTLSRSVLPLIKPVRPSTILYSARTYATMTDTATWKFNHTMLRVKDPQRSIEYYKLLGMSVLNKLPMPDAKFDNYFLGQSREQPYSSRRLTVHSLRWS